MDKVDKKKHVRDTWIPDTWRYNGSGYQRTRKKNYLENVNIKRDTIKYLFYFVYIWIVLELKSLLFKYSPHVFAFIAEYMSFFVKL